MEKKAMKKICSLLMAISLLSMTACGGNGNTSQSPGVESTTQVSATEPQSSENTTQTSAEQTISNEPEITKSSEQQIETTTTVERTTTETTSALTKITFSSNRTDQDEYFKELSIAFNQKYPDYEVEIETIQDYHQVMNIRLQSGDASDVLYLGTSLASFSDYYAPLDDMGYSAETMNFYDAPKSMYQGVHYGLSETMSVTGILASRKTLEENGINDIPKTKDELFSALENLKTAGLTPMGSMAQTVWPLISWETLPNANFNKPYDDYIQECMDTKMLLPDDSPYEEVYSFILEMKEKGYFGDDIASSDWDILRMNMDTCGMLFLASYGIGALEATAPDDVVFFPFPFDNSGQGLSMATGDWFIACNKNTAYMDTAKDFIRFWLEESGYADQIGSIPTVKSVRSNNKQVAEFMAMNPIIIAKNEISNEELLVKWTEIINTAQASMYQVYEEMFLTNNDYQAIREKYNAILDDAIYVVFG